ncbi:MAG: GMC family oxidoreductase N-terminal domain-containing protein [Crocosphaera sp.]|nr:GMC family oxidoreductase N-terminal domain-containing protein [Crocosphaera sp.]
MDTGEAFDYIIVGSGATGCVLVNRLSANSDVKVLLLEAGGSDKDPNIENLTGFINLWGTEKDWQFLTEPQQGLKGRQIMISQGKVIGGSTSINAMMYVRGNRRNYDLWESLGNEGWGYEKVLPYFKKSEKYEEGASVFHGDQGPLSVRKCPDLTSVAEAFIEACVELGYGGEDWDFNGSQQENGASVMQFNMTADNQRASSASAFLTPILDRPNLKTKTYAQVTRVLFEDNRAIGVEYVWEGKTHQVRAEREVIISAGAFLSPKLLMLSGIGPAEHLRTQGISVLVDLPGVGQNLQDHLRLQVIYKSKRELPVPTLLCETALFTATRPGIPPNLQLNFSAGVPNLTPAEYPFEGPFSIFVPILVQPQSRGVVKLRSNNPLDAPIIDPQYLSADIDRQTYEQGIRICREIANTKAFADFNNGEVAPGIEANLEEYIRQYADTIWHPVGTCRMGYDSYGVVDAELRVHGVEGLRVADASIMPYVTSGNTCAACVMIGEKLSDIITAEDK